MFGNLLSGWHLVIVLLIVLVVFGGRKLPGLAKSVGQSMRIFKSEIKTMNDEDDKRSGGEIRDEVSEERAEDRVEERRTTTTSTTDDATRRQS